MRRLVNWLGMYLVMSSGTGVPVCLILAMRERDIDYLAAAIMMAMVTAVLWLLWGVWYTATED